MCVCCIDVNIYLSAPRVAGGVAGALGYVETPEPTPSPVYSPAAPKPAQNFDPGYFAKMGQAAGYVFSNK